MKAHRRLRQSLKALTPRTATLDLTHQVVPILYKRKRPVGSERRRLAHEKRREAKRNRKHCACGRVIKPTCEFQIIKRDGTIERGLCRHCFLVKRDAQLNEVFAAMDREDLV